MPDTALGPFRGVRVLDCATILAAPLTAQILGDYGADVVKVEHPSKPDGMRGHGHHVHGAGLWWSEVGRNKRTIGLDLKHAQSRPVFLKLIENTDVLIENFRPGTLDRWGYDWATLHAVNPRLIVLRVTGFGQEGPYRERPAFGTLIEAMSGFAHLTGNEAGPPTLPAFGLADSIAGITGAAAVSMALYERDARGGLGQEIDLSLLMPLMTAVGPSPAAYHKLGIIDQRHGNRSTNNAPRNLYLASDGVWIAISTSSDSIARRVMALIGHPEVCDEPWFATGAQRAEKAELLDAYVSSWVAERTGAQVIAAFEAAGAAAAPVYTSRELVEDPQVRSTKMLTEVDDPQLGPVLQHNVLFGLSRTPGGIRFAGRPPSVDTTEVLSTLAGLSAEELEELREAGAIR